MVLSPFLKLGVISASFNSSGNLLILISLLLIFCKTVPHTLFLIKLTAKKFMFPVGFVVFSKRIFV